MAYNNCGLNDMMFFEFISNLRSVWSIYERIYVCGILIGRFRTKRKHMNTL